MKFYYFIRNAILSLFSKTIIGVRILLISENKVLLVKHTYQPFWYTVGGGVDPGETPIFAMQRELLEEAGVTLTSPPKLFSVYHKRSKKRDDYVIFYVAHDYTQVSVTSPEIAEQKWFPLNELPEDISPATQRRIQEYLGLAEVSEHW